VAEPIGERTVEVRMGSATNALAPLSVAERPLGAGIRQWTGLTAVAVAALIDSVCNFSKEL
jgi:hypothetical protein